MAEELYVYACAVMASVYRRNTVMTHNVSMALLATDKDDATGKAYVESLNIYPRDQEYYAHTVSVVRVPDAQIAMHGRKDDPDA